ncbi:SRPBCC domain-containing protein [Kitasatospora sp. NPDC058218]|uniref:SRPBCC family protein n=1 Tax=Kitasatospora sp. NPDC058218 TaxID=3346385 RepID=UPI0036D9618C
MAEEHPVGLTRDAGFQIGVSRTLPHPPEAVWDLLTSPEGAALWLGPGADLTGRVGGPVTAADGSRGELRSRHPGTRIRLTWQPAGRAGATTVQVTVTPSGGGTVLRFHQERLDDPEERARQRDHWRAAMDAVAAELAPRRGQMDHSSVSPRTHRTFTG